jgi:hypothetical protein
MTSVANRMHAGRRAWVARTKAEGKPLTFAGFRPKGSGLTREARAAAIAMRDTKRARYKANQEAAETAKATVQALRMIAPPKAAPGSLSRPEGQLRAAETVAVLRAVLDTPAKGPFARTIARQHGKALKAALPIMQTMLGEGVETALTAKRRDEFKAHHTRMREMACRASRERQEAMDQLEAERAAAKPMTDSAAFVASIAVTTPAGREPPRHRQTRSPVCEPASMVTPARGCASRPPLSTGHRGQERVVVRHSPAARVYGSP